MDQAHQVTAYRVALTCEAAPRIGCGSLAKPVLREIESQTVALGAWLNRQGTVLAIVWPHATAHLQSADRLQQILTRHGLTATALAQSEHPDALKDFASGVDWYPPAELDRLSDQEARIIAERMVNRLRMKIALGSDQTQLLVTVITKGCSDILPNVSATSDTDRRDEIATAILGAARAVLDDAGFAMLSDVVALGHRPLHSEE
jgi:hypothetical protein